MSRIAKTNRDGARRRTVEAAKHQPARHHHVHAEYVRLLVDADAVQAERELFCRSFQQRELQTQPNYARHNEHQDVPRAADGERRTDRQHHVLKHLQRVEDVWRVVQRHRQRGQRRHEGCIDRVRDQPPLELERHGRSPKAYLAQNHAEQDHRHQRVLDADRHATDRILRAHRRHNRVHHQTVHRVHADHGEQQHTHGDGQNFRQLRVHPAKRMRQRHAKRHGHAGDGQR
jgi:hypothetical protein